MEELVTQDKLHKVQLKTDWEKLFETSGSGGLRETDGGNKREGISTTGCS